jgi:hypothetical protein
MSAGGEKRTTACVTGGNGYIASALIKMLLEKGYAVKTTVRDPGSFTSFIPFQFSVSWSICLHPDRACAFTVANCC